MAHRPFVAWPSARTDRGLACYERWVARGYEVLVAFDDPPEKAYPSLFRNIAPKPWPGYYGAANRIAQLCFDLGADVVTMIGDDMDPDPKADAQEIALRYFERFPDGFGVLQACGDPQGMDSNGTPAAARICGSPTFGKGWANRAFGGTGAFPEGFHSFYGDELLKEVSERLGLLWMEPSLSFFHRHWSFGHTQREAYHERNQTQWENDRALFMRAKGEDFASYLKMFVK